MFWVSADDNDPLSPPIFILMPFQLKMVSYMYLKANKANR